MTFPFIAAALGFAKFVPSIKRWLSGQHAQSISEQVVKLAQEITGSSSPEQAIHILSGNKKLACEFQKEVLKMDTEIELALIADRQHARERDLNPTGRANKRADLMVLAAALGLVMCLFSLAFYSDVLPGEAVGIISTIAGIFGSCLKDAYSFEFGSSRGSKVKDSTVASAIERLRHDEA